MVVVYTMPAEHEEGVNNRIGKREALDAPKAHKTKRDLECSDKKDGTPCYNGCRASWGGDGICENGNCVPMAHKKKRGSPTPGRNVKGIQGPEESDYDGDVGGDGICENGNCVPMAHKKKRGSPTPGRNVKGIQGPEESDYDGD